ncbi:Bug family tripartite tricarboxylate transporter substrate binding protein [Polaromonas sp. UC242_47]|uniref:Bug family tripartite tricarboxylate transporter substrate binding protein n=1 Tax=Polaromonas sp. UC242_47 TaxID=3374626 RepID=UPI00379FC46B
MFNFQYSRRKWLALMLLVTLPSSLVLANDVWPSKPIRMIVGFAPGGPTDSAARFMAEGIGKELGTSVIIENKPGANGQNSIAELKRAKPDGYTLLFITSGSLSVAPARYKKLPYDIDQDFEYIGAVAAYPSLLITSANSKFNTLGELIAASKKTKEGLSAGTVSNTQELTLELFKNKTGVMATGIPYRGDSHAITDIVGGTLDFAFLSPNVAIPMIENGRVKAIGVTGELSGSYASKLPKLDALDVKAWSGIVSLKGTPGAATRKIGNAMHKVLMTFEFKKSLEISGQTVLPLQNEVFRKFVMDEKEMWERTAKSAGLEKL